MDDKNMINRRPLTTRNATWAKTAASWLAKNNVSPNFISVMSIVFASVSFFASYCIWKQIGNEIVLLILIIAGIQLRLLMNLLDGMVAVEHDKKSVTGTLFNEVPDRIADTLILFGVGLIAKSSLYGMDLAYLAIALSVTTAYIRVLGDSLGCGQHFIGPMAKQHRMAFVTLCCVIAIWYMPVFWYMLIIMNIGLLITCYRRLAKIVSRLKQNPTP